MKTKLNAELYDFFSRNVPKLPGESDQSWKERIKNNPGLVDQQIRKAPFSEQLKLVAMRRALAVAGGQRTATGTSGPNNSRGVASAYEQDFFRSEESRKKFATDMVNFLDSAFEYGSPVDGSIFWTGIDENKLVKQVEIWNRDLKGEIFGQLEATTDARYINGAFDWNSNGAVQTSQMFFGKVSETYGAMAKGHVTSVQMWGLRNTSIFTTKELPTLLKHMGESLQKGKAPAVQDLTIVVLDPLDTNDPYKCFTNNEIGQVPIVYKHVPDSVSKWIRGKQDIAVQGYVNSMIPARLKAFWFERGKKPISRAAVRIIGDYNSIKR